MNLYKTFLECLAILSKGDKRKYWTVVVAQGILGFLDLLGVAIMGIIGALAIRGVQSQPANGSIGKLLDVLNMGGLTFQIQVAVLGVVAATVLITRTMLGMYLTWKILNFLSVRSAKISSELLTRITDSGYIKISKFNSAELQYILGPGVSSVAVGVLGTASTVLSDVSTLAIVAVGIVIIDPAIAVSSITLFALVGALLYFKLHKFSERIGRDLTTESIQSNKLINEMIGGYRELYVRDRLDFYKNKVTQTKYSISEMQSKNSFLPNISKYVIEVAVVIGAALVSAAQFVLNDATHAFASLGIFLAAGTRIAPALLRLQQGAIGIKSNIGMSHLTLEALREFSTIEVEGKIEPASNTGRSDFSPHVSLTNLKFRYESSDYETLNIPNLEVFPGTTVALVGPSGSGKTTLIDVMLGVLTPQSGQVLISGLSPKEAIKLWPEAIAYVPQMPMMKQGSIAQNIALGFGDEEIEKFQIEEALRAAQLEDFVNSLPSRSLSEIGEKGVGISGGQLQRLGIARALYLHPKLIVLDEATSALDGITEKEISDAISELKTNATLVIIAHRLSTVVNADQVFYLNQGKIVASGSFEEVRTRVPDFDKQAKLMGL